MSTHGHGRTRDRSAIRPEFVPRRHRSLLLEDPTGLVLDEARRVATYRDADLRLTGRQFDLLLVLIGNSGQLITPRELALYAWGERLQSDETVRAAVKAIRTRLRAAGHPLDSLVTVWGLGYRWDERLSTRHAIEEQAG